MGSRAPPEGAKRKKQKEARGPIGCPGWWKEYGISQRDSPLPGYLQGEVAGMRGGLHVLICKIGIITSILKGWFEIKLDEVCKSMIYTLYQQQNAHKTESILNICRSREHGSRSKQ